VEASNLALGVVLAQPREGKLYHPIYHVTRKIQNFKNNCTIIEWEGLAMTYSFKKFRHYLINGHFTLFTDHPTLKYYANKLVLEGCIYRRLLLFQKLDFEVIIKLGKIMWG
jgi:hypothetical protein